MSRLRVAHCIGALPMGGTETALTRLIEATPDVEPLVISLTDPGPTGTRLAERGVRVEALGKQRATPSAACLRQLRRLLLRERPHVLQTWLYEANLYGLVAARPGRIAPVAWNLRCSDMPWERFGALTSTGRRLNGLLSGWPDAIVANSQAGLDYHSEQGFRSEHAIVIRNGFDTRAFRPDDARRASVREEMTAGVGTPVIGLVGRNDPAKDVTNFVRAAELVHTRRPEALFVLAGPGFGTDNLPLHRKLCASGFRDRWRLLGERDDVPAVMNALDLLIISSRSEAFPNVLGEAMACATPAISTDVGDVAEVLADPERLVPAGHPGRLAAAILAFLRRPASARAEVGRRDRARIESHYTLERTAERYRQLWTGLAGLEGRLSCAA